MAWFITLGCVQRSITFPAFLTENQSFVKKFEENKAEIQRIETGTLRGVAQLCLLFSMLMPVLVYPILVDLNFLEFFLWQNCLDMMDCSQTVDWECKITHVWPLSMCIGHGVGQTKTCKSMLKWRYCWATPREVPVSILWISSLFPSNFSMTHWFLMRKAGNVMERCAHLNVINHAICT